MNEYAVYFRPHIRPSVYMGEQYVRWDNYAAFIADKALQSWKTHPHVSYMLEHEWDSAAKIYIDYLLPFLTVEQIQNMASVNDTYGVAEVKNISDITTSSSSIRYIRHAYDICDHIRSKSLQDVSLIEIGGGYGGLALTTFQMADILGIRIKKYSIFDLPGASKLQKYYLSLHGMESKVEWGDPNTYGATCDPSETNVLVSCYSLSEIADKYRAQYLETLLPRIKAAFFVWNWGSKIGLPEIRDERVEVPDTSAGKNTNGQPNTIIRL